MPDTAPTPDPGSGRSSFFRQSGWMVIATFIGGIFMAFVQTASARMPDYTTFNALLRLLIVFGGVPSAALQTIFTQQAAAAVTPERERGLTASTQALLKVTGGFWFIIALWAWLFTGQVCRLLQITDPMALRIMSLAILCTLWSPIFKGLLQGQHRFGPLGGLQMFEGAGRLMMIVTIVVVLKGHATGGLFAVFSAQLAVAVVGGWLTRGVWAKTKVVKFNWQEWLKRGVPLTFGMGSVMFISSIDFLFVNSLFFARDPTVGVTGVSGPALLQLHRDTGHPDLVTLYSGAMLTGYAIIQFIAPITSVMFPRIVRSVARAEKTDALALAVIITAAFGCLAAIGCTILPRLPLQILYITRPAMVQAAPLVRWFGWALMPLTVANVLIQNLLARERFEATPWLMVVPIVYGLSLMALAPVFVAMPVFDAFAHVVQIIGCSSLLLFAVAAWFTWRKPATRQTV
jgi:O-antigen/teichoic acid export membrane protein